MRVFWAVAVLSIAFYNSGHAQPFPGSVQDGRIYAMEVCSECHVVAPSQGTPATDAVPTFASIAANPAVTEMSLRVFLRTPHAQMPDFIFSRIQADNIISYILSLKH